MDAPPPTFSPPHESALRTVPAAPPDLTAPQVPTGFPVVNARMVADGSDVVVLVEVVTVVVLVDVVSTVDEVVVVDSTVVVVVSSVVVVVSTVVEVDELLVDVVVLSPGQSE